MANIILVFAIFIALISCDKYYEKRKKPLPKGDTSRIKLPIKTAISEVSDYAFRFVDRSWLRQNRFGLWEMYLEGKPFDRGVTYGLLAQNLMANQEAFFYDQVQKIVSDQKKLIRLLKIVAWYNHKLPNHFSDEYQQEILGESHFMNSNFDWVGPPYFRALNLHGTHDIGHTLQDLMLVGCTSFAAWGGNSKDGKLIIGRNFDFYAGKGFSEEKMVVFMKPEKGIPFMLVSWPGFLGAVSGMNAKGLTVTINAGKSKIPLKTGTPISILTREILQYATNIEEAIEIAKSRKVFVSESILIGSAADGKAVIIEKSPKKQGLFVSGENQLVCSNHFQSEAFKKDKKNEEHIEKWHSQYRYERMNQLLDSVDKIDYLDVASILRNKEGFEGKMIGYGNEKAINQMVAHHGIIFKPEDLLVWVSANPCQMGEFVCYDLNKVFKEYGGLQSDKSIDVVSKTIPEDPFIRTKEFQNYLTFRKLEETVDNKSNELATDTLSTQLIQEFLESNPDYYLNNYKLAKYYQLKEKYSEAILQYEIALSKEVTTVYEVEDINERLKKCRKKIK